MAGWLNRFWPSKSVPAEALDQLSAKDLQTSKKILFYRDFLGFTGGHLKVWHYFNHVRHSTQYKPYIAFSAATIWDETNPWLGMRDSIEPVWQSARADVLFLAGMDWAVLNIEKCRLPSKPVINLIQHVRHADPKEPLYQFLKYRAVRICVSEPVADALRNTQRVNGPIFTINNGIDLTETVYKKLWEDRQYDLLIMGIKQPSLAMEIYNHLNDRPWRIMTLTKALPQRTFLELLGNSKVVLLLPHQTEGFYLPALEGFALKTLVICPDCVGNRGFCFADYNCLQPAYTVAALLDSVHYAFNLPYPAQKNLLAAGWRTVQQHSILQERQQFLELLQQIEMIW